MFSHLDGRNLLSDAGRGPAPERFLRAVLAFIAVASARGAYGNEAPARNSARNATREPAAADAVSQAGRRAPDQARAAPPQPRPRPDLQPPRLLDFVEADYPQAALEAGREGRVVLHLTIDTKGNVTVAEIGTSAGEAFDAAALTAATQFRFAPARRNGEPIPARIRYTYQFELPAEAALGRVTGRVMLPGTASRPAVGARVRLNGQQGTAQQARTDTHGRFRMEALPAGRYELQARGAGLGSVTLPVVVTPGETTELTLKLLPGAPQQAIDVTVRGRSDAERLRRSAQAVQVIETEQAKKETADLGEVLARSEGVGVRRGGGLGSGTRFSLNGLTDDQIRFFMDGVPLALAGYPFGIGNVPVNLVERVDVYRGVVPVRFGADALGGAVNLVTGTPGPGTHGSASYQTGAFGTHRLTLGASHREPSSGVFARAGGFFDRAQNDYPVDVEVPDARGRLSPARVYRFHDAYQAGGVNLRAGVTERPWADRLQVRLFGTDYHRELQHNIVMTVPYGEITFDELNTGATLRYEHALGKRLSVDVLGGFSYTETRFLDVGECVYDWFGQCVRERRRPGELGSQPRDRIWWERAGFARINAEGRLAAGHTLRLSVAPTFTSRTGDERRQLDPQAPDPFNIARTLLTVVSGLEYEAALLNGRLENVAFIKDYAQRSRSQEPIPGGMMRERNRNTHRLGVGNALRYAFSEALYTKASYEWATRLPRPDEVFGDGMLIIPNLQLRPETSHNVNLGITLDALDTAFGAIHASANAFLRAAEQLIVLLGNEQVLSYQNVFEARSIGAEVAAGWRSPGEHVGLDANATYLDFRNTSTQGAFGEFAGDRIPNRPYLFANGAARMRLVDVAAPDDALSLSWNTRYVHAFFRGWESAGAQQSKQVVPAQLLHSLALTYSIRGEPVALTFTTEAQNLTNARAYDFFGVQRPGRAIYFKTTAEL